MKISSFDQNPKAKVFKIMGRSRDKVSKSRTKNATEKNASSTTKSGQLDPKSSLVDLGQHGGLLLSSATLMSDGVAGVTASSTNAAFVLTCDDVNVYESFVGFLKIRYWRDFGARASFKVF